MPKSKTEKRSAPPGGDLIDALVRTTFVVMAVLNKIGADNDLSLTQLRVLGILRDRRPRMAALAERLGLEKSTMTGLIDRAEERGLLARAPSADDGRAMDVFLTREGAALAERLYVQVLHALGPVTEHLTPSDRRRLLSLLDRMLEPPKT